MQRYHKGRFCFALYAFFRLGGDGVYKSGEAGNFSRCSFIVDHTLFRCFIDYRFCGIELIQCCFFRFFAHSKAHAFYDLFYPCFPRLVAQPPLFVLARAFYRRFMISQLYKLLSSDIVNRNRTHTDSQKICQAFLFCPEKPGPLGQDSLL